MKIYCIEDFKKEYEKLIKKNSYKVLTEELINLFSDNDYESLKTGVNLNNNSDIPFLKRRLRGKGGFRLYYLLIIVKDSMYLVYVHPKTGKFGQENIDSNLKTELYKKIFKSINDDSLYEITCSDCKKEIYFIKSSELVIES